MISVDERKKVLAMPIYQLELDDWNRQDYRRLKSRITFRDIQILDRIAGGNTNKQIAYTLGISEQTVKNHLSSIFCKLNANDRAHAVALAMRQGLITYEEDLPRWPRPEAVIPGPVV